MGRSPRKKRRARKTPGRLSASRKAKKAAAERVARPARRRAAKATGAKADVARLSRELSEALAHQAATSEVLQVISSSPGDLKPVFDQMLAKAMRLCEAQCGFIYQIEQGAMRAVAEIGVPPAFAEYRRHNLHTGGATTPADAMRATKRPAHVHDARDSDAYRQGNPNAVAGVELGGARTVLYVPMIRNDDIAGVINVYRQEVRPFTDEQIALLENFASQAVIAIENVRLFNETKEALERQTATAEILKVIAGSPTELRPVFEAIAARSVELVGGHAATVSMFVGDRVDLGAFTPVSPEADAALTALYPRRLADYPLFELVRGGEVAEVTDIEADPRVPQAARATSRKRGVRSLLFVPLNGRNGPVGTITIARNQTGRFASQHIQLMQTFADQAVIAIQNTRLFNETREALERQTATADILKVIASSPDDVRPVFQAIADQSNRLLNGLSTAVYSLVGDVAHLMSFTPVNPVPTPISRPAFRSPWRRSCGASRSAEERSFGSSIPRLNRCDRERGRWLGTVAGAACCSYRF
jgi:GAF domain-containing protein